MDYDQGDGSSPHDTRPAGYGSTSASLSLSPPMLSSYEPYTNLYEPQPWIMPVAHAISRPAWRI
eukprot:6180663-Pleurochrysis_carterae.AAC.3